MWLGGLSVNGSISAWIYDVFMSEEAPLQNTQSEVHYFNLECKLRGNLIYICEVRLRPGMVYLIPWLTWVEF